MRLSELVKAESLSIPSFEEYKRVSHLPEINVKKIRLAMMVGDERLLLNGTNRGYTGDVSAVLYYKKRKRPEQASAITCISEHHESQDWYIGQVKGIDSQTAYRLFTSFSVPRYFGHLVRNLAYDTRSEVKRILLPFTDELENIPKRGSRYRPMTDKKYAEFCKALEMRRSDEEKAFILDVGRG